MIVASLLANESLFEYFILMKVEVEFGFIPKPDEQSYSKQWLVAEPSSGTIQPGRSCEVRQIVSSTSRNLDLTFSFNAG